MQISDELRHAFAEHRIRFEQRADGNVCLICRVDTPKSLIDEVETIVDIMLEERRRSVGEIVSAYYYPRQSLISSCREIRNIPRDRVPLPLPGEYVWIFHPGRPDSPECLDSDGNPFDPDGIPPSGEGRIKLTSP